MLLSTIFYRSSMFYTGANQSSLIESPRVQHKGLKQLSNHWKQQRFGRYTCEEFKYMKNSL